jgi:hypothetical protein
MDQNGRKAFATDQILLRDVREIADFLGINHKHICYLERERGLKLTSLGHRKTATVGMLLRWVESQAEGLS